MNRATDDPRITENGRAEIDAGDAEIVAEEPADLALQLHDAHKLVGQPLTYSRHPPYSERHGDEFQHRCPTQDAVTTTQPACDSRVRLKKDTDLRQTAMDIY